MSKIDWEKAPAVSSAELKAVGPAVERLYGLPHEQLQQLAVFRIINPDIVSAVTGVPLNFRHRDRDDSEEMSRNRRVYATGVTTLKEHGLIKPGDLLGNTATLFSDGQLASIWDTQALKDPDHPNRAKNYVIGGEARPEWKQKILSGLNRKEITQLHASAAAILVEAVGNLAHSREESDGGNNRFASRAVPLLTEYVYHQGMAKRGGGFTSEPVQLALCDDLTKVAKANSGGDINLEAALISGVGWQVKEDRFIKEGDPQLSGLYPVIEKRINSFQNRPQSLADLFPGLQGFFPGSLDNLFVRGAYSLFDNQVPDRDSLNVLILKLAEGRVQAKRGVILTTHSHELEFRTEAGLVIQLHDSDHAKAEIAAIELGRDGQANKNEERVVIYRRDPESNNNDWTKYGELTATHSETPTGRVASLVTFKVDTDYKGRATKKDGLRIPTGVTWDRIAEATVSTDYYSPGNVVIGNGDWEPVVVNPVNSSSSTFAVLPHTRTVPRVAEKPGEMLLREIYNAK